MSQHLQQMLTKSKSKQLKKQNEHQSDIAVPYHSALSFCRAERYEATRAQLGKRRQCKFMLSQYITAFELSLVEF